MLHLNCIDTRYSVFLVSGGDVRIVVVTAVLLTLFAMGTNVLVLLVCTLCVKKHIHRHSP